MVSNGGNGRSRMGQEECNPMMSIADRCSESEDEINKPGYCLPFFFRFVDLSMDILVSGSWYF